MMVPNACLNLSHIHKGVFIYVLHLVSLMHISPMHIPSDPIDMLMSITYVLRIHMLYVYYCSMCNTF